MVQYQFNADSSYVVCVNRAESTPANPFPSAELIVVKRPSNKIVWEYALESGGIEWINAHQIRIRTVAGNIEATETPKTEIYDLKTKKFITP